MNDTKPKNWPGNYIYSPECVGKDIHISILRLALFSTRDEDQSKITPCIEEKRAHPHLEIRQITSSLRYKGPKPHPLVGTKTPEGYDQYGVFAKKKIHKGTDLAEFVGEAYLLSYNGKECSSNWIVPWKNQIYLGIDSQKISNELMYVNDYRGLKDAPNANIKWMVNRGFYYFGYSASRDIEQNEEIVIDYGKDFILP